MPFDDVFGLIGPADAGGFDNDVGKAKAPVEYH